LCAAGAFAPAAFVFYDSAGIAPGVNPNRSSGFVKLRAYAWQIALRPAEGVAGYGKAGREDR